MVRNAEGRQRERGRQYSLQTINMTQTTELFLFLSFARFLWDSSHYLHTPWSRQPLWAPLLHLFCLFLQDACVTAVTGSGVLCCCAERAVAFQYASPQNSVWLVNGSNLDESQRTHGKSGLLFALMLRTGERSPIKYRMWVVGAEDLVYKRIKMEVGCFQ